MLSLIVEAYIDALLFYLSHNLHGVQFNKSSRVIEGVGQDH